MPGRERVEQPVHIQRPAGSAEVELHADDVGREDLRDFDQVRPQRRHDDHAVARRDQRLHRQHQSRHAGRRNCDCGVRCGAMQPRHIAGNRVAQRRDAEVLRIERFAARKRRRRGIANEAGRDLVRFAEPEGEHVGIVHPGVRDLADPRRAERTNRVARDGAISHQESEDRSQKELRDRKQQAAEGGDSVHQPPRFC